MKLLPQIMIFAFSPMVILGGIYLYQIESLLERLEQGISVRQMQTSANVREAANRALRNKGRLARLFAREQDIMDALQAGDSDMLFRRTKAVLGPEMDFITFIDADGIVIARGRDEFAFGDSLLENPLVKEALQGKEVQGLASFDGVICLVHVQPVRLFDVKVIGALAVGVSLEGFLREYANDYVGVQFTAFMGNEVLTRTAPYHAVEGWDSLEFSEPLVNGGNVTLRLHENLVVERQQLQDLRRDMLGLASGLALILGLALAFFARRLARPINALVKAMRAYPRSSGELERIPVQANEIGQLTKAFQAMTRELEAKQQSLEQAENKYRGIFENSLVGIFQSTLDGRLISANAALAGLFGFDSPQQCIAELGDIRLQLYIRPKDRDATLEGLLRDGFLKNHELELKRKDGQRIWLSETSWLVRDAQGEPLYLEGSLLDISEIKRAQKLEREKAAAQAASAAKSQFLAAMSHEIRTPMNAVMGMAELLRGTKLDAEQRQYLNIFEAASESLLSLLGDILDISRIEAGQLQLENIPFSVQTTLETICKVLSPRATEKGLTLKYEVGDSVPDFVRGDPTRLRQVCINLVGNAIKFTREGEVGISVKRAPAGNDNGQVRLNFSVRDTGIGIRDEDLVKIFDRFTQADSSITRDYGGSGLGLTICKSLVELMGGAISVQSNPGEGSTFFFGCVFEPAEEDFAPELPRHDAPLARDCDAPLRVLLVEDSEYNAFVVLAYLKDSHCLVDVARNGAEGVEFFRENKYDIVLMDMRMPVMDGYSATRAMRGHERERGETHTPIIAMTAQAFVEDVQRSLDAGCDLHLAKPIRKDELLDALRGLVGLRGNGGHSDAFAPAEKALDKEAGGGTSFQEAIVVHLDPDIAAVAPRYLQSVSQRLNDLKELLATEQWEPLRRSGHQMKGEGEAFGFSPISEMGAVIQTAAEKQDADSLRLALQRLADYLERVELG